LAGRLWVAGDQGVIWMLDDQNWKQIDNSSNEVILQIWEDGQGTIRGCGKNGLVFHIQDASVNIAEKFTDSDLVTAIPITETKCLIGGERGELWLRTDSEFHRKETYNTSCLLHIHKSKSDLIRVMFSSGDVYTIPVDKLSTN